MGRRDLVHSGGAEPVAVLSRLAKGCESGVNESGRNAGISHNVNHRSVLSLLSVTQKHATPFSRHVCLLRKGGNSGKHVMRSGGCADFKNDFG